MKRDLKTEMRELLEGMSDSYSDFVEGMIMCCDTDERKQKLMDFINGKEEVTTSDVLEFYLDEIRPEKKK